MSVSFIHVAASGRISFFSWMNNVLLYTYVHHSVFIHLSTDRHLSCSHILAVMNNTAINMRVQESDKRPRGRPGLTDRCSEWQRHELGSVSKPTISDCSTFEKQILLRLNSTSQLVRPFSTLYLQMLCWNEDAKYQPGVPNKYWQSEPPWQSSN